MSSKRNNTTDLMTHMSAALIKIRAELASAQRAPAPARPFIQAAQEALNECETAIRAAVTEVPRVMNDRRVYPDGRRDAAREQLAALDQLVTDRTAVAQRALQLARQQLRNAALLPVNSKDALTAREDAKMILDRADPKHRDFVMAELAKRQDSVGALVASQWGRDYLATCTDTPGTADAMHASVVDAAVQAAASQSLDEGRREAATYTDGALPIAHGLRDSVMHVGRMVSESLRDDHGLRGPIEGPVASHVSDSDIGGAVVSDNPIGSLTF